MPAGLQVINNTGILQVSENYRNYLLERKFTMGGTLINTFPRYGRFYTFTAPTGSMVACQPVDNTFVSLYSTTVSGEVTTYEFVSPISGALLGASATCTFYVFSLLLTPPNVPYGLEVYNANGVLCFSSNNQYMKPVTAWSGQDYYLGMQGLIGQGGFTYYGKVLSSSISRSNHAFVFGGPSGYFATTVFSDGDNRWWYDEDIYYCMAGWRGGSLILADELIGGRSFGPVSFQPQSPSYSYTQYYHMVVDITNYL